MRANYSGMIPETATDKELNDYFKDYVGKDVFLGQWKVGLDAEYDFGFAKVAAGISAKNAGAASDKAPSQRLKDEIEEKSAADPNFNSWNYSANQVVLGASASISTESIIPGAELKLAWENGDDLLKVFAYNADKEIYNYGKITASCTIEF